jgi:CspA family cold shock protein
MIGSVKFFNVSKGYGFIACEDGQDAFLGSRELERRGIAPPRPGARMCFDVVSGRAGKREATRVTLLDEPDADERADEPRPRAARVWTHPGSDEV